MTVLSMAAVLILAVYAVYKFLSKHNFMDVD